MKEYKRYSTFPQELIEDKEGELVRWEDVKDDLEELARRRNDS